MDPGELPAAPEEFYRTLVENAAEGMLTIDAESRIVYANPAIEEILGYRPEELIGSSKMQVIPERLQSVHAEALAAYVETGERHIDWNGMELPALHKDGHEVPTLISLREHEYGGEQYFTGIIRDVSDRREREAELQAQKERLDQFADILAHDIRNPLSVAAGYTEIAREEHDAPELERVADALGRIEGLIDDVLVLSKQGQQIGETERVSLDAAVHEAWDSTAADGATLEVEGRLGSVEADRSRFRELLTNLFGNAVEHGSTGNQTQSGDAVEHGSTGNHTQSGDAVEHGSTGNHTQSGDAVEHAAPDTTVTVGPLPDGFYVADDGPGVPEEIRENVFEHGYSTRESGTGFGLSIVRQIAEAHGWEISLTESEAGGARFEIRTGA